MAEFLFTMDYWLFNKINSVLVHPYLDVFFFWITDLHKLVYFNAIVIPLIAFLFIYKFKREGVSLFLGLILALTVSDFAGGKIKKLVMRERPANHLDLNVVKRTDAGNYSFYSNHASNMFTFAVYTGQFIPQTKIPLLVLASLVSYSRIYNGVHFPSDVISGGFMGTGWGLLFSYLINHLLKLIKARKKTP